MSAPYSTEIFCTDDGGRPGRYWVLDIPGRNAEDAVRMVAECVGVFKFSVSATMVTGTIEETSEGARFTVDEDGDLEAWEVEGS